MGFRLVWDQEWASSILAVSNMNISIEKQNIIKGMLNKKYGISKSTLSYHFNKSLSSNGRTTDFQSVDIGSTPLRDKSPSSDDVKSTMSFQIRY